MIDPHENEQYRSGLEAAIAKQLQKQEARYTYEDFKIPFIYPERSALYLPDFLLGNGIIIEAKGQFTTADRKKMKLVKQANPDLDIRFVFNNPNALISKRSTTSYAKWCTDHGFKYAKGLIPPEWIEEKYNPVTTEAVRKLYHQNTLRNAEQRKRKRQEQEATND